MAGQTIKVRRGTAAEWVTANPVLALAEQGYETDMHNVKFGDGVSTWTALPYTVNVGAFHFFTGSFNVLTASVESLSSSNQQIKQASLLTSASFVQASASF
jgi:hypothetical protein